MGRLSKGFTVFVNIALKLLLVLALGQSLFRTTHTFSELGAKSWPSFLLTVSVFLVMSIFYIYIVNHALKVKTNYKKIIILILCVSFGLRLIWVLLIHTTPVSDFSVIYESGRSFINGDYSMFQGNGYIARFTHLTLSVIYYGAFHFLFPNPLIAIKISNVLLSTLNVFLIYLIVSEVYNSKIKGTWAAVAASIFPAFIMYTSVTCTENHAMTFYLASIYIFLLVVKEKRSINWMVLSGVLLSFGHVFRMVGSVVIVAYLMYVFVYMPLRKSLRASLFIILSFLIPIYLISTLLINLGITEYPLWRGREPNTTSILRGTNIEANGTWNEEDAKIPEKYNYDYDAVDKASKEIIKERLTTTPPLKLVNFYIGKFISEWSYGDFASLYWSTIEVADKNIAYDLSTFTAFNSQLIYSILFLLLYAGLFNKNQYKNNRPINLFYILYCGFALLYLITENQSRYGYIACWLFVVMAPAGFIKLDLKNRINKLRVENGELRVEA